MAPILKDLQLTKVAVARGRIFDNDDSDDLEDVRLLDSYDDGDGFNKIEAGIRRVQVSVSGMTCAACSNSVEGALNSVNGVLRASVALLQNKADVVFDPILVKVS